MNIYACIFILRDCSIFNPFGQTKVKLVSIDIFTKFDLVWQKAMW